MRKRIICVLLAVIMMFSFSGCSLLRGFVEAVIFLQIIAASDDRASMEDIEAFVTQHTEELYRCIEAGDYSPLEQYSIIKEVSASEDAVDFYCGGAGVAPSTIYCGFFYSPDDDMTDVWCAPSSEEKLTPSGDGFEYTEGDNRYYTEKICDNFYFYEASY